MKDLSTRRQEFFTSLGSRQGGVTEDELAGLGFIAHHRNQDGSADIFLASEEGGRVSATMVERQEGKEATIANLDIATVPFIGDPITTTNTNGLNWIQFYPRTDQTTGGTIYYPISPNGLLPERGETKIIPNISPTPKSNYKFDIASVEVLDPNKINQAAFAKAGIEKQPDLLYVRFKLMHEGGNKNLDWFDGDELKAASHTPIHKPLNWEHGEPTIGHIYYSEFVPAISKADGKAKAQGATNPESAHIIAEAAVYKFRYPEIASKMIKRHSSRMLTFSMEAYFSEAECSQCGEVFAASDHPEGSYCDHLNKRFETAASAGMGSVFRKLRKFILGGAGVVEDPADVGAEALALAKTKEERRLDKIELTQVELDAKIKAAVSEALAEADNKADVEELKTRVGVAEKTVTEQKTALESAIKTIETLTSERDEVKAELQLVKDKAVYDAKANERKSILDNAGYVVPENTEEADKAFATIMNMSDDVFELFTAQVKAGVKKEVKPVGTSQASARIPASGGKPKSVASTDKGVPLEAAELLARL
jgi:hypothetical protein